VLAALRFTDYRRYWTGSFIANVGFWMQQTALGWIVYDMTQSASWLGTIALVSNAPTFVVGIVGGAVADRASRRTIILSAQLALAACALALALLTATGHLTIWRIITVAVAAGTAAAFSTPAMMAVLPGLVPAEHLLSAISLNSVQFNLARTLGPAVAGLGYGVVGAAGCFAANAAGFVAFALMLARLPLGRRPEGAAVPLGRALRDGLRYIRAHPVIGPSLLLAAVVSFFGFPYIILLPALARDLGLGVAGLGTLMAAVGTGAVTGGLGLAAVGDLQRKGLIAGATAIAFGAVLASLVLVDGIRGTALTLAVLGVLQTVCVASLNTAIQLTVHDGMRGRVMSVMTVILFGLATLGSVVVGFLGDRIGIEPALATGGVIIVMAAVAVLPRTRAFPGSVERAVPVRQAGR